MRIEIMYSPLEICPITVQLGPLCKVEKTFHLTIVVETQHGYAKQELEDQIDESTPVTVFSFEKMCLFCCRYLKHEKRSLLSGKVCIKLIDFNVLNVMNIDKVLLEFKSTKKTELKRDTY